MLSTLTQSILRNIKNTKPSLPEVKCSSIFDLLYNNLNNEISTVILSSAQRGLEAGKSLSTIFSSDITTFKQIQSKIKKMKSSTYYLGTMIFTHNKNKKDSHFAVIDGQQRLIESLVYIACIRDLLKAINSNNNPLVIAYGNVCNNLLFNTNHYHKSKSKIFLQVPRGQKNSSQYKYQKYFNALLSGKSTAPYKDTKYTQIERLSNMYHAMRDNIEESLNNNHNINSKFNTLKKLLRTFLQNFFIVKLILSPDKTNTDLTFNNINSRKSPFTVADHVHSQLVTIIHLYNQNTQEFKAKWSKISNQLLDNTNTISKLISTYYDAKYRHYTRKNLPKAIGHNVTKIKQVNEMVNNLSNLSKLYRTLLEPLSYSNGVFNKTELKYLIQEFDDMGLIQYYPIILAMYHFNKYSENDIYKVMCKIAQNEMRRQVQHEVHTKYIKEAHNIWHNHKSLSTQDIINDLNNPKFNDDNTQIACQSYFHRFARTGKSILILVYIIAKIADKKHGDFKHNIKYFYHTIFKAHSYRAIHIASAKINGSVNDLVDNIGNYTLIDADENHTKNLYKKIDPKNPNPKVLITILSESKLTDNQKISKFLQKNGITLNSFKRLIRKRQKEITNAFLNIW